MNLDEKLVDIKLKEYEQNMNTYRYLADMNVKYVMFFLIVASFTLKIYVDANERMLPLLLFIGIVGGYSSWSIHLVHRRMSGLANEVNRLCSELQMAHQNFQPFLFFLRSTTIVTIIVTFLVIFGMYDFHALKICP